MGRLHTPGLGEKLDRITILELKEEHIARKTGGDDFIPFRDERHAIEATVPVLMAAQLDIVAHLRNVNGQLWDAEDYMREMRPKQHQLTETEVYDVVRAAFTITELNDRRAALIGQLNESAGDGWLEKV
jgi:hypothetical protein